jgi:hypothetical protein
MNERFTFTLVEIAPAEEFFRMTSEERLKQNNAMVNRVLKIVAFMENFFRGWVLIKLHKSQFLK